MYYEASVHRISSWLDGLQGTHYDLNIKVPELVYLSENFLCLSITAQQLQNQISLILSTKHQRVLRQPALQSSKRSGREKACKVGTRRPHPHNNASPHTCNTAEAALGECGFEVLPLLHYSPDLASCDFRPFLHFKQSLWGKKSATHNDVVAAVAEWRS